MMAPILPTGLGWHAGGTFCPFDAMQKQGQIWENEAQVDTTAPPGPNCWRPAVMLTAAWTSWPGFYCRWICRKLCVS
ncbi:MAG: hypothetical protein ACLRXQ_07190 [Phascolarctobacterium faecium]